MTLDEIGRIVTAWIAERDWQIAVTILLVGAYVLLDRLATPRIAEGAEQSRFNDAARIKAIRAARVIVGIFALLILTIVWGVDIGSVMIFATTAITLLGVALFASWSILSNVTAYFIIIVHPSFRRGNFVRLHDADNYVEGYISEVLLFSTRLLTEDREVVVYPNNLLLARPAIINPRNRLNGIGKLEAKPAPAKSSSATPPSTAGGAD